ncbi:hypothetical protein ACXZ1K_15990 [Pedobacter sp. PWIIR3]
MEPFKIHVSIDGMPDQLNVEPQITEQEDHKYKIYNDGAYLATVWPDCVEKGVCWYSSDELPEETVIKIGEAIERYER